LKATIRPDDKRAAALNFLDEYCWAFRPTSAAAAPRKRFARKKEIPGLLESAMATVPCKLSAILVHAPPASFYVCSDAVVAEDADTQLEIWSSDEAESYSDRQHDAV